MTFLMSVIVVAISGAIAWVSWCANDIQVKMATLVLASAGFLVAFWPMLDTAPGWWSGLY